MTIPEFLEKAIEGGWSNRFEHKSNTGFPCTEQILLDPLAWQAVGKIAGWSSANPKSIAASMYGEEGWKWNMHGMVNALIEGKTIEEFISTL